MAALSQRAAHLSSSLRSPCKAPKLPARKGVVARQLLLGAALHAAAVVDPAVAPPITASGPPLDAVSARPPSTGASAAATTVTAPDQQPAPPPAYIWARNWVPVCPVSSLDPSAPTPVVLLGQPLVVWRHSVRGWVVMRDVCPHRLAPLSEGRLEAGGTRLACSYHGWEFSEEGRCTRVPQLASDPRASATACASKRSCVTSFPTLELDGILFAWLDASEEGLQAARTAPKPELTDERAVSYFNWFMNEMPADYTFWLEQSMDPTHANFLHEGVGGFRSTNARPLDGKIADKVVDLLGGFTWQHGGYQASNAGMQASRQFQPPFLNRICYTQPNGSVALFWIMSVPVRPGVTRTYFKGGFGRAPTPPSPPSSSSPPPPQLQNQLQNQNQHKANGSEAEAAAAPAPAPVPSASAGASSSNSGQEPQRAAPDAAVAADRAEQGGRGSAEKAKAGGAAASASARRPFGGLMGWLRGRMPHWAFASQLIADQDLVMMCRQELLMRRGGLTARDYNLNSKADGGVAAVNVWLRRAGYPDSLWGGKPVVQSGPTYSGWPAQELSLEQMLSRQERHVRHCTICQRGLKQVTALCTALTVAAGLAAAAAVVLAVMAAISPAGVAAAGGWWALVGVTAAGAALAVAAIKGWSFREERFISGAAQWRRLGGFASQKGSKAN
ncbi:hypothetical protein PLESTB_000486200 [Pleodorina starrii]|uniref:Rieske domain-containing protein n=1 Tax=Pleodorina starrii TaxID=330485 RepID=A0A9W6BFM1_9CHLO|nr:hypothetical protein PLESTM_000357400 [Pleodorina starrii]GLC51287.1 hypothetical protein PLESTB_000486200 [Pleodorina starrii]GLC63647.1 hypothetical protein PLESTF_000059100 [Pleodorina starrii]